MKLIKISNLLQINGQPDYKGLDLEKIVPGTQLYPDYDNVAYFEYDGEVAEGGDVRIVTRATYDEHKNRITNQPRPMTPEDEIAKLKQEDLNNKEAIAELYLLSMGGF